MEWQQLSVRKCIPRILTTTTSNQCNKCGIQFKKVALATVKKSNAIEFISDVQHNTDTRSEIRYQKPVLQAWEENIWHFSTFIVITYSCSTVTSEYPETFFFCYMTILYYYYSVQLNSTIHVLYAWRKSWTLEIWTDCQNCQRMMIYGRRIEKAKMCGNDTEPRCHGNCFSAY